MNKTQIKEAFEIVNRRIAILEKLGEDVRRTSAWRDAMHELTLIKIHSENARP